MKHLLSLEKLSAAEMRKIIAAAKPVKAQRARSKAKPLAGQTWALIFS